jgi:RNA polymerase sigma-70 factor (ECF subfamily)
VGALRATRADDLALAQRAAQGERGAQRALFAAQKLGVHHTLYRILGANRDLEDLIQDAFLEIFRALPSFRGDSSLNRWCQTIATRVAYLAIERRKPVATDLSEVEDSLASGEDGHRRVEVRAVARRLYAALERIDPKMRIAFALVVVDGRTPGEVAQLTDATTVAVRTRVWRARRALMKRVAHDPVLAAYIAELEGEG